MTKLRYTRRKFYGKWLYKVTVSVPGVSIFRLKPVSEILMFCIGEKPSESYGYTVKERAYQHKTEIRTIADTLAKWNDFAWSKRIEDNIMDIYMNDQTLYYEAIAKLGDLVVCHHQPAEGNLKTLDSGSNVVVKKYPHNRYKHKVFLLPHKIVFDSKTRKDYLDWLTIQSPRISISEAVKKWFMTTNWNWDRRYIYVEDDQSLLLLKLRNSEVVGKVYNYVLADK
jgi:hypothetical protein